MATRRSIADLVLLRISKGYPDSSSAVQLPDVIMAAGQMINAALKQQYFSNTLQLGETIPDGVCITPYTDIPVKSENGKSYCMLPVLPISLPMGLGIYEVSAISENSDCEQSISFIPLLPGQSFLLKGQDIICDLLGNVGYEQNGFKITFTKDVTRDGIDKVDIKLVVTDINKLSDYDPLPIDKGMEAGIVEQLIQQFAPAQTNNDVVDNLNTEKTEHK